MYSNDSSLNGGLSPQVLEKYGIMGVETVFYNLSYEELFAHETNPNLEGFERGFETNLGAVAVDTGIYTGRSPKDKYIVKEPESENAIWWADPGKNRSDNNPITEKVWHSLKNNSVEQLTGKKLYVMDAFCGANENTRIKIRVITEIAWMAHFVKNMFIRPSNEELVGFEPDFVMLHACKAVNTRWEEQKLNSDVYIAFNLKEQMAVIGGTWYGGEIKKGFFTIMNYLLPLRGIASMHCSANMGKNGDTAIFFGLSGTGKTTLSTEPDRFLIGDDEHGWDEEGIFNLEGGCYAKCVSLKKELEPDIYNAIRRNALLENVVYDTKTGEVNFFDTTKTENTRVSYPIDHIPNIVRPVSRGPHPKRVIFLTADAFGVFPPVAKLSLDQAKYYFLSGYTAKLAGTERGIKEPIPTFSAAFGAAFLMLHPTVYAQELANKLKKYGSTAYLVNTGWIGGPYGIGQRIDINSTRKIIKAILDGSIEDAETEELTPFGLRIPTHIEGVDSRILNPISLWKYESAYRKQADMLAEKFIDNFNRFTDTEEGQRLVAAGPQNQFMKQYYGYYQTKISQLEQKHKDEISRLKDQIYILQNSFNEYITFNSINTDYKRKPLHRYVPVLAHFGTNNEEILEKCHDLVINIIKAAGFEPGNPQQTTPGVYEYLSKSYNMLTHNEVVEQINHLANCIDGKYCQNQSIFHLKESLMSASSDMDRFAVKIGYMLILKDYFGNSDHAKVITRKLSISGLIHIDKNPWLLMEPNRLLEEINFF